ncbi:HNH endonuclease [Bacillus sp. FSL M7-0417]|uniref:HNH endonuclease n=1 Tax=Bacillus sp. FSL M7-0417 TaxID=2921532 RepID=UPI002E1BC3E7|nr:HNH endonuclease [Bacillus subtilis]
MIKNKHYFEGDTLIIVVERRNGERIEFKFDANDFGRLSAIGKKFSANSNKNLIFYEGKKVVFVKDFIMNFPQNRVSHTNKDNTDLRKSNLKCFGIRNKFWVEGDTLVIEVQDGNQVLFDVEDFIFLEQLDARISTNNKGYAQTLVDGQKLMLHRYLMEVHFGDEVEENVIDHINGRVEDNRKSNLRITTRSENNMSLHKSNNKHGFPHIVELPKGKWLVQFTRFPEMNQTFDTIFEALRYSHLIHEVKYGANRGTVASYENLIGAIKQNGGYINEVN